jgi:DNA-binding MarR family transcriptional regulator
MTREDRAREMIGILKRLSKLLKTSVFSSMEVSLKPSPFLVLMQLCRARKRNITGMRVSDIAEQVGMSVPGTTQILNGLAKDGLVVRETDPRDRRVVHIRLTEEGNRIMEPAISRMTERFIGLVDSLGEADSEKLVRLLQRVEAFFLG